MMQDFKTVEEGSVMLLQVSGHNPTGIDPTKD